MKTQKLTREQVLAIPKELETLSQEELAKKYQVHSNCIRYWVKKLRAKGHIIKSHRGGIELLGT